MRAPGADEARVIAAAEVILQVVGAALEPYGLSRDEIVHAIRGLRGLAHGSVSLELNGGFGMPQNVQRSFDWAVRTYVHGLSSAGGPRA